MPTLHIPPNLDVHYVVDDYTDPWRQPATILLLHGNAESSAAWYGWVPQLAPWYRVVRPDMRGFGASTPMPRDFPWTLDLIIDDFCRLMDTLEVERFHLIGAKIGGTIARIRIKLSIDSFRTRDGFVLLTYVLVQDLHGCPSFSRSLGRHTCGGGPPLGEEAAPGEVGR